jgi:hypothetical protein
MKKPYDFATANHQHPARDMLPGGKPMGKIEGFHVR